MPAGSDASLLVSPGLQMDVKTNIGTKQEHIYAEISDGFAVKGGAASFLKTRNNFARVDKTKRGQPVRGSFAQRGRSREKASTRPGGVRRFEEENAAAPPLSTNGGKITAKKSPTKSPSKSNNNKIAKIAEEESTAKLVYAEQEKAVQKKLLTEVTQLADAAEKRIQSRK